MLCWIETRRSAEGEASRSSERKGTMRREGVIAIVNACIWGLVMITTALALKGTGAYQKIQLILGGGAAASLLVVIFGLGRKSEG
jgi:Mg/Co/Ni transporter MgtE